MLDPETTSLAQTQAPRDALAASPAGLAADRDLSPPLSQLPPPPLVLLEGAGDPAAAPFVVIEESIAQPVSAANTAGLQAAPEDAGPWREWRGEAPGEGSGPREGGRGDKGNFEQRADEPRTRQRLGRLVLETAESEAVLKNASEKPLGDGEGRAPGENAEHEGKSEKDALQRQKEGENEGVKFAQRGELRGEEAGQTARLGRPAEKGEHSERGAERESSAREADARAEGRTPRDGEKEPPAEVSQASSAVQASGGSRASSSGLASLSSFSASFASSLSSASCASASSSAAPARVSGFAPLSSVPASSSTSSSSSPALSSLRVGPVATEQAPSFAAIRASLLRAVSVSPSELDPRVLRLLSLANALEEETPAEPQGPAGAEARDARCAGGTAKAEQEETRREACIALEEKERNGTPARKAGSAAEGEKAGGRVQSLEHAPAQLPSSLGDPSSIPGSGATRESLSFLPSAALAVAAPESSSSASAFFFSPLYPHSSACPPSSSAPESAFSSLLLASSPPPVSAFFASLLQAEQEKRRQRAQQRQEKRERRFLQELLRGFGGRTSDLDIPIPLCLFPPPARRTSHLSAIQMWQELRSQASPYATRAESNSRASRAGEKRNSAAGEASRDAHHPAGHCASPLFPQPLPLLSSSTSRARGDAGVLRRGGEMSFSPSSSAPSSSPLFAAAAEHRGGAGKAAASPFFPATGGGGRDAASARQKAGGAEGAGSPSARGPSGFPSATARGDADDARGRDAAAVAEGRKEIEEVSLSLIRRSPDILLLPIQQQELALQQQLHQLMLCRHLWAEKMDRSLFPPPLISEEGRTAKIIDAPPMSAAGAAGADAAGTVKAVRDREKVDDASSPATGEDRAGKGDRHANKRGAAATAASGGRKAGGDEKKKGRGEREREEADERGKPGGDSGDDAFPAQLTPSELMKEIFGLQKLPGSKAYRKLKDPRSGPPSWGTQVWFSLGRRAELEFLLRRHFHPEICRKAAAASPAKCRGPAEAWAVGGGSPAASKARASPSPPSPFSKKPKSPSASSSVSSDSRKPLTRKSRANAKPREEGEEADDDDEREDEEPQGDEAGDASAASAGAATGGGEAAETARSPGGAEKKDDDEDCVLHPLLLLRIANCEWRILRDCVPDVVEVFKQQVRCFKLKRNPYVTTLQQQVDYKLAVMSSLRSPFYRVSSPFAEHAIRLILRHRTGSVTPLSLSLCLDGEGDAAKEARRECDAAKEAQREGDAAKEAQRERGRDDERGGDRLGSLALRSDGDDRAAREEEEELRRRQELLPAFLAVKREGLDALGRLRKKEDSARDEMHHSALRLKILLPTAGGLPLASSTPGGASTLPPALGGYAPGLSRESPLRHPLAPLLADHREAQQEALPSPFPVTAGAGQEEGDGVAQLSPDCARLLHVAEQGEGNVSAAIVEMQEDEEFLAFLALFPSPAHAVRFFLTRLAGEPTPGEKAATLRGADGASGSDDAEDAAGRSVEAALTHPWATWLRCFLPSTRGARPEPIPRPLVASTSLSSGFPARGHLSPSSPLSCVLPRSAFAHFGTVKDFPRFVCGGVDRLRCTRRRRFRVEVRKGAGCLATSFSFSFSFSPSSSLSVASAAPSRCLSPLKRREREREEEARPRSEGEGRAETDGGGGGASAGDQARSPDEPRKMEGTSERDERLESEGRPLPPAVAEASSAGAAAAQSSSKKKKSKKGKKDGRKEDRREEEDGAGNSKNDKDTALEDEWGAWSLERVGVGGKYYRMIEVEEIPDEELAQAVFPPFLASFFEGETQAEAGAAAGAEGRKEETEDGKKASGADCGKLDGAADGGSESEKQKDYLRTEALLRLFEYRQSVPEKLEPGLAVHFASSLIPGSHVAWWEGVIVSVKEHETTSSLLGSPSLPVSSPFAAASKAPPASPASPTSDKRKKGARAASSLAVKEEGEQDAAEQRADGKRRDKRGKTRGAGGGEDEREDLRDKDDEEDEEKGSWVEIAYQVGPATVKRAFTSFRLFMPQNVPLAEPAEGCWRLRPRAPLFSAPPPSLAHFLRLLRRQEREAEAPLELAAAQSPPSSSPSSSSPCAASPATSPSADLERALVEESAGEGGEVRHRYRVSLLARDVWPGAVVCVRMEENPHELHDALVLNVLTSPCCCGASAERLGLGSGSDGEDDALSQGDLDEEDARESQAALDGAAGDPRSPDGGEKARGGEMRKGEAGRGGGDARASPPPRARGRGLRRCACSWTLGSAAEAGRGPSTEALQIKPSAHPPPSTLSTPAPPRGEPAPPPVSQLRCALEGRRQFAPEGAGAAARVTAVKLLYFADAAVEWISVDVLRYRLCYDIHPQDASVPLALLRAHWVWVVPRFVAPLPPKLHHLQELLAALTNAPASLAAFPAGAAEALLGSQLEAGTAQSVRDDGLGGLTSSALIHTVFSRYLRVAPGTPSCAKSTLWYVPVDLQLHPACLPPFIHVAASAFPSNLKKPRERRARQDEGAHAPAAVGGGGGGDAPKSAEEAERQSREKRRSEELDEDESEEATAKGAAAKKRKKKGEDDKEQRDEDKELAPTTEDGKHLDAPNAEEHAASQDPLKTDSSAACASPVPELSSCRSSSSSSFSSSSSPTSSGSGSGSGSAASSSSRSSSGSGSSKRRSSASVSEDDKSAIFFAPTICKFLQPDLDPRALLLQNLWSYRFPSMPYFPPHTAPAVGAMLASAQTSSSSVCPRHTFLGRAPLFSPLFAGGDRAGDAGAQGPVAREDQQGRTKRERENYDVETGEARELATTVGTETQETEGRQTLPRSEGDANENEALASAVPGNDAVWTAAEAQGTRDSAIGSGGSGEAPGLATTAVGGSLEPKGRDPAQTAAGGEEANEKSGACACVDGSSSLRQEGKLEGEDEAASGTNGKRQRDRSAPDAPRGVAGSPDEECSSDSAPGPRDEARSSSKHGGGGGALPRFCEEAVVGRAVGRGSERLKKEEKGGDPAAGASVKPGLATPGSGPDGLEAQALSAREEDKKNRKRRRTADGDGEAGGAASEGRLGVEEEEKEEETSIAATHANGARPNTRKRVSTRRPSLAPQPAEGEETLASAKAEPDGDRDERRRRQDKEDIDSSALGDEDRKGFAEREKKGELGRRLAKRKPAPASFAAATSALSSVVSVPSSSSPEGEDAWVGEKMDRETAEREEEFPSAAASAALKQRRGGKRMRRGGSVEGERESKEEVKDGERESKAAKTAQRDSSGRVVEGAALASDAAPLAAVLLTRNEEASLFATSSRFSEVIEIESVSTPEPVSRPALDAYDTLAFSKEGESDISQSAIPSLPSSSPAASVAFSGAEEGAGSQVPAQRREGPSEGRASDASVSLSPPAPGGGARQTRSQHRSADSSGRSRDVLAPLSSPASSPLSSLSCAFAPAPSGLRGAEGERGEERTCEHLGAAAAPAAPLAGGRARRAERDRGRDDEDGRDEDTRRLSDKMHAPLEWHQLTWTTEDEVEEERKRDTKKESRGSRKRHVKASGASAARSPLAAMDTSSSFAAASALREAHADSAAEGGDSEQN
ncbi:hypothetical protein BESB_054820 [Besnoitia besnoiti]|uniref:Uncharacterized protein n=1 Tax=Besnoitia besnoiti TaxID=94643 RepID=A0A2A9MHU5_BESBE|nr:hypothetical protein BESB_054820 [Besnoitia besnoiti]PFH35831.1 hypothetical protein BESB_054820 [Besnoitia besnoiti]